MLPKRLVERRFLRAAIVAVMAIWAVLSAADAQELPVTMHGSIDDVAVLGWEDQNKNLDLNLDPSVGGGDILQIRVSSTGIEIALLLPTGQLITKANAASFGYVWETIDVPADSEVGGLGAPSPGRHESIRFPAAQPAGVYQIQASRSSAGDPVSVMAGFQSRSGIRFGVNVAGRHHQPNQPVTVAGLVFDEETPIAGATVSGSIHPLVELSSGVALGGWQLQEKTDVGNGRSHYAYIAALQNTVSAFTQFRAEARQPDETVELDAAEMWFRDVAQGETKQCSLCFGFTGPTSPEPAPSSFPWRILAEPDPIPISLSDSTSSYPTVADGVYTGTFTSPYTGEHWIDLRAEGTGPDQRPFTRTAGTSVTIEPRPGYFLGVADSLNDSDADGKVDEIKIVASVHVDQPGLYSFGIELRDSTGASQTANTQAELVSGTQQLLAAIPLEFVLADFGADGPYSRLGASLRYENEGRVVDADFLEDAGPSQPYVLDQLSAGELRLIGTPSLEAVDTGEGPAYEILRLTIGLDNPEIQNCVWSTTLADPTGAVIETVEQNSDVSAGSNELVVDFSGPRIARHGVDGPYSLQIVDFDCDLNRLRKVQVAHSAALQASDFENKPANFALSIPPLGITPNETRLFIVHASGENGFDESITLSIEGLPPGVQAEFSSALSPGGVAQLKIVAGESVAAGTYSITIQGASNSLSKVFPCSLVVSSLAATVSITPNIYFLHPGMTVRYTATVANASTNEVTWALVPPAYGSVALDGLYTAPGDVAGRTTDVLTAMSVADPSRIGSKSLVLLPQVIITLTPEQNVLRAGQETWIHATLENNGNQYDPSLGWTTTPQPYPGGTTIPHPLKLFYRAPTSVSSPQTVTVNATFAEDPAALGTATLTLLPEIQIEISPSNSVLYPLQSQQFAASVSNDPSGAGVSYSLSPELGSIDPTGLYTAPVAVGAETMVTLTASSVADPTKSASATITLRPSVMVAVAPLAITLFAGQTQQFSATVETMGDPSVTWSVSPETGSIDGTGFYTAPASVTVPQIVTLTATSVADPTKSASATVALQPYVAVSVSPPVATLLEGHTQLFAATVMNATDTSVTWSVSPSVGTVSASGLYTAPATISSQQIVAVTATSVEDPTKSASATVTLHPPVAVSVSPTSATLSQSQTRQFTATVANATNTAVTWTRNPAAGTVDGNGLFTAPSTISTQQTITVTATSVEDPSKSASATVTLQPPVAVNVSPASATLGQSQTQQFTATVTNAINTAVTWTRSPAVGTVDGNGLYTAPSSISMQQSITVTATSVEDPSKSASATVTLQPPVGVSVSPTSATLSQSQTRQFTATVTNATDTSVTWSVSPSVGTVSASGLYTVPATISTQQTITVTATSVEDPSKSASATVTLRPPVAVSVSPTSATLGQSQTRQFTATVTNATNTSVTWTRSPAEGTVSASGLYTAPATISMQQTVTVTATSVVDPSKSASATVTLQPPVAVSISPTSATLGQSQTRQFTATVTNATNTAVTWTRSPAVGTVSVAGLYTAPSTISSQQTVAVTATSVEDPTKSASATVTLTPPPNQAPTVRLMAPTNSTGWANVFKYEFLDSNGSADIAQVEVVYSASSNPPFANSCWFVYTRSTNSVRLYNNAGTAFVSGSIAANSSSANLENSKCMLVGGSLRTSDAGNTFTMYLGIGFATGTTATYTARMKAADTAGAATSYVSVGTWTIPAASTPPNSPQASGTGTPSASLEVTLIDANNTSLSVVDIDDIQTLITKTGASTNACHFYYFAPAEMIVLLDDDDIHWAGISKAGPGGGAIGNTRCLVNAAQAYKTYDYNTKRFGIVVPVTAFGTFTGNKYVYVGGSDRSGNIVSTSWVHSWSTNGFGSKEF